MDDSPLQTSASVTKAKPDKEKELKELRELKGREKERERRREREQDREKELEKEREREKEIEREGYNLLVEKMEQVRSQMIKMERKYDELYKTFKERDHAKSGSVSGSESSTPRELKSPKDSVTDANLFREISESSVKPTPPPAEDKSAGKQEMDIEKMEDNPFL